MKDDGAAGSSGGGDQDGGAGAQAAHGSGGDQASLDGYIDVLPRDDLGDLLSPHGALENRSVGRDTDDGGGDEGDLDAGGVARREREELYAARQIQHGVGAAGGG